VTYRGPRAARIGGQFQDIQGWAGESCIWRQYVSAASATSGYYAGGGTTRYYRQQTITGLLWTDMHQVENLLPGGMVMAGDVMISTPQPLGDQDEVVWSGVTYRVEGDTTPMHLGGRVWYATPLKRGDTTG